MRTPAKHAATFIAAALLALLSTPARADDKPISYDEHIVPIFRDKCFSCHNPDKKSGGLVLNNYSALMTGGGSGEVVFAGDAEGSRLYALVAHLEEPFMPPMADKLPADQLETIRKWIQRGALENAGSKPKAPAKPKFELALKSAPTARPDGPPPMPQNLPLEPVVRTARTNAVTALASSPWAPLVAVAAQKQILLYHSETLELLGVLPFPEGMPHVVRFSRNGSLLLAAGGRGAHSGRVVIWNVASGERVAELGDEFDSVLAADISADQTQVAIGGPSKLIRMYSTTTGELLHEIKKHTEWVTALEFSPDGVLLATGDRNGGLFVWEANTAREYLSLRAHTAAITDVSWRSDSNLLASASEDTTIRLWEMENGGNVKGWGAHGGGTQSVAFAQDGRIASCGRDRVTKLWDQNGAQQRAFEPLADLALRVTFSHDASRVIAGDWTGQIRVWASADGKPLGNLDSNPPTIAERLEVLTRELATRKAAHQQLAGAAAASRSAADKAATDLASAQKAAADLALAAKGADAAVAAARAAGDQAAAAVQPAQHELAAREAAARSVAEIAGQAKELAAKAPDNAGLADARDRTQQRLDKASAEVAAAQKALADRTAAAKAAADQLAAASAAAQKAAADATAAAGRTEPVAAAAKAAADKAAADQAAADQAAAAAAATEAALAHWTAARARATEQARLDKPPPLLL